MTSGLATLVAGIWTEAGYETTISRRNGDTYVLAEHESDGTYDLLWILDDDERITVPHLDRFRERIGDLSVNDAYVVSPRSVDEAVERAAATRGVQAVGIGTLRTLADQSGVGQVAVDAALATTVGPDETATASPDEATAADETAAPAADDGDAESGPIDLTDPQRQAEIRQRLAVMIGEADPDDDPDSGEDHGPEEEEESLDEIGTDEDGDDVSSILDDADEESTGDDPEDDGDGTDGEGLDDGDDAGGGDPLAAEGPLGDDLADVPDPEETDDSEGPLKSRRGLITGGVAAILTAGVLDLALFNVVLGGGGGGMPAYNETRVKADATETQPSAILAAPDTFVSEEVAVVYDGTVTEVAADGSLWTVTLAVEGGTVVGRWDGEEPAIGQYTVWGVVTGTTTVDGDEVPTIDIVDMVAGGGGGGTTTSGG